LSSDRFQLRQLRSFSDTISLIFDITRSGFKPMLLSTLRICGPWLVIGAIATTFLLAEFFTLIANQSSAVDEWDPMYSDTFLDSLPSVLLSLFVSIIVLSIGAALQMCIVYVSIRHYADHGEFPDHDTVRVGMRRYFWRALFAAIVSNIMVSIASQFFYLPGIYLSVPLGLLAMTVVAEDTDIGKGLSRVFALIKDRWWYSFGILLVVGLAEFALVLALAIPGTILTMGTVSLVPTLDIGPVLPLVAGLVSIAAIVLMAFAYLLTYVGYSVLYYQHAERIDGIDLGRRVASLDPDYRPAGEQL
jgi:hypothetical protein